MYFHLVVECCMSSGESTNILANVVGRNDRISFQRHKVYTSKSIVQIGVKLTDDSGMFKLKIIFNINLSTTGRLLQTNLYAFP